MSPGAVRRRDGPRAAHGPGHRPDRELLQQGAVRPPTSLPWGLQIPYQYRVSGGIPSADLHFSTFQPTFLYEPIFDFAWAWCPSGSATGSAHRSSRPAFSRSTCSATPLTGSSRSPLRIDSSAHIFGLRLNFYIATILAIIGAVWFVRTQRRPARVLVAQPALAVADSSAPESSDATIEAVPWSAHRARPEARFRHRGQCGRRRPGQRRAGKQRCRAGRAGRLTALTGLPSRRWAPSWPQAVSAWSISATGRRVPTSRDDGQHRHRGYRGERHGHEPWGGRQRRAPAVARGVVEADARPGMPSSAPAQRRKHLGHGQPAADLPGSRTQGPGQRRRVPGVQGYGPGDEDRVDRCQDDRA